MKWGALALLVLIATGVFFWKHEEPVSAPQQMAAWQTLDASRVSTLSIQKNGEPAIELHRQGNQWMIAGKAADAQAVQRLLNDLSAMRPVRIVTRKRDHDALLGLDAHAITVKLTDAAGKPLLHATIGKQGANLISTYLRLQGEDVVYAVNKPLVWQLNRSATAWGKTVPHPAITASAADAYATDTYATDTYATAHETKTP